MKDTWSKSHPAEGWYTTERPASWKRLLVIRNSSLAPTFQMKPSNFPVPSPELLPGNLPFPLLWSGKIKCAFYRKGETCLSLLLHVCPQAMAHTGTVLKTDMGPPPLCVCDHLWGTRVKVEDQSETVNNGRTMWPWKPPLWTEFCVCVCDIFWAQFLPASVTLFNDFTHFVLILPKNSTQMIGQKSE